MPKEDLESGSANDAALAAGEQEDQSRRPSDAAELIRQAFDAARASGKEDWHRMQAGVLKNRLLLLTAGEFSEKDWGYDRFTDFLEALPELVQVDRSTAPPAVQLVDVQAGRGFADETRPQRPRGRWRVRSDLWAAVLNYDSPNVFVWDDDGAVHEVPADQLGDEDPRPRLPTLAEDELRAWREDFAARHRETGPDDALEQWAQKPVSTWSLAPSLRTAWFSELKDRVSMRLQDWFTEQHLALPDDFVSEVKRPRAAASRQHDDTAELRAVVVRCIEAMTRAELEELRLPPAAVLRSQR